MATLSVVQTYKDRVIIAFTGGNEGQFPLSSWICLSRPPGPGIPSGTNNTIRTQQSWKFLNNSQSEPSSLITSGRVTLFFPVPVMGSYTVVMRQPGAGVTTGSWIFGPTITPDVVNPVISGVVTTQLTTTSQRIVFQTNEGGTTQVEYGLTTGYGSVTELIPTIEEHQIDITGLTAAALYNYRIRHTDFSGNQTVTSNLTFTTAGSPPDTTPPTFLSIVAGTPTQTSLNVTWMTNEPASSQIEYGFTTGYGSTTTLDSVLKTSHNQTITGLTAGTLYNYRLKGTDAAGNTGNSSNRTVTTAPASTGVWSPTGRNPTMLLTQTWFNDWNAEKIANSAIWNELKNFADQAVLDRASQGFIFRNQVGACIAMFHITGTTSYADAAFSGVNISAPSGLNDEWHQVRLTDSNWIRENLIETAVALDLLEPWLDLATFPESVDWILNVVEQYLTDMSGGVTHFDWRADDSDELIGSYFGMAIAALLGQTRNPTKSAAILGHDRVRGFTPTGPNPTDLQYGLGRDMVDLYVRASEGGIWIEGAFYNPGTTSLLHYGWDALKVRLGADRFPLIAQLILDEAKAMIHQFTPDLATKHIWNDTQFGFGYEPYREVTQLAEIQRATGNAVVQQTILDIRAGGGSVPLPVSSRFYLFFDPNAPTASRTTLTKTWHAPGQGFVYHHDDWGALNSSFAVMMLVPRGMADHHLGCFTNFQLWRKNEWVIDAPKRANIGEGDPNHARNYNQMSYNTLSDFSTESNGADAIIGGLTPITRGKGWDAFQNSDTDGYVYYAGHCRGLPRGFAPNPLPNTPVTEWTRAYCYLPSTDKTSDVFVVMDRMNGPLLDKAWFIHLPTTTPTVVGNKVSWNTNASTVAATTLLPASITRRTFAHDDFTWSAHNALHDPQPAHEIRQTTPTTYETWLNVVEAKNLTGVTVTPTLISATSPADIARGVLVTRTNQNDYVVMFGAQQSSRKNSFGYTFNWTSTTTTTKVIITDLDSTKTWTRNLDAGGATALTVSSEGVAVLTVTGTGNHTIVLAATP